MKKIQIKENYITKIIIGLCVIIFLFIFYDVLIKSNSERTTDIEIRIETKIDDINSKADKTYELVKSLVDERIEQLKGNTLFNSNEDTIQSKEAVVVKQNLEKLKEESFDNK